MRCAGRLPPLAGVDLQAPRSQACKLSMQVVREAKEARARTHRAALEQAARLPAGMVEGNPKERDDGQKRRWPIEAWG